MCSLTFFRSPAGLLVTMNRDEYRHRIAEIPPKVHVAQEQQHWMAPADGQIPNTWIGVNQVGFGGCLLNRYPDSESPSGEVSRGTLLPELLGKAPPTDLKRWLRERLAERFSPFTLVIFDAHRTTRVDWNGHTILGPTEISEGSCCFTQNGESWALVSSSSWRTQSVNRWRCRQFEKWWRKGTEFRGLIPTFHLQSQPTLRAWSPLMSRRHTCTRSITQIRIDISALRVQMNYWPYPNTMSREPSRRLSIPLTGSVERYV